MGRVWVRAWVVVGAEWKGRGFESTQDCTIMHKRTCTNLNGINWVKEEDAKVEH